MFGKGIWCEVLGGSWFVGGDISDSLGAKEVKEVDRILIYASLMQYACKSHPDILFSYQVFVFSTSAIGNSYPRHSILLALYPENYQQPSSV